MKLPTVDVYRIVDDLNEFDVDDIILSDYESHPTIKAPLSN